MLDIQNCREKKRTCRKKRTWASRPNPEQNWAKGEQAGPCAFPAWGGGGQRPAGGPRASVARPLDPICCRWMRIQPLQTQAPATTKEQGGVRPVRRCRGAGSPPEAREPPRKRREDQEGRGDTAHLLPLLSHEGRARCRSSTRSRGELPR